MLIRDRYSEFVEYAELIKWTSYMPSDHPLLINLIQKSDIDVIVKVNVKDPVDRGDVLLSLWANLRLFFKEKLIY